jgi:hypothetical protein
VVAAIVKLDDAGLFLLRRDGEGAGVSLQRWLGGRLIVFAPWLMKALGVVGTLAMFMVGGGILLHGVHFLSDGLDALSTWLASIAAVGPLLAAVAPALAGTVIGLLAGAAVLGCVFLGRRLRIA